MGAYYASKQDMVSFAFFMGAYYASKHKVNFVFMGGYNVSKGQGKFCLLYGMILCI